MSAQRVAELAGVSEKTVRKYETEGLPAQRQHFEKLERYAAVLGITPEGVDRLLRGQLPLPHQLVRPQRAIVAEQAEVRAEGRIAPVPEWTISTSACRWVPVPICSLDPEDPQQRRVIETGRFRLLIDGDCMEPEYPNGALVEFQIVRPYEPLVIGCDYVFCRNDGTATFKALVAIDDDMITLAARNQDLYPGTFDLPRQELTRVARAVGVMMPAPGPRPVRVRPQRRR